MKLPFVTIYADGSCLNNGKENASGGWAAIVAWRNKEWELSGGSADSPTNNKMELTAVIEALRHLGKPCNIKLITDSQYVCNRLEKLDEFKENCWTTSKGCQLKNVELLMQLKSLIENGSHVLEWQHVPAHAGLAQNERCDAMAKAKAKEFQVIF